MKSHSPSPNRVSPGDRFISQRGIGEDAETKFNLKVELFSCDMMDDETEERKNSH